MAKSLMLSAAAGLLSLAMSGGASFGQDAPSARHFGTWGFDLAGRDLSVKPGDDFAQYATGTALKALKIPPDQSRWGAFNQLRELSNARVHAILEEMAAKAPRDPQSDEGKIGAFYKAFMDEKAVEARGVAPLTAALAPIKAARSREELARLMGRASVGFGSAIFGAGVNVDAKNPTAYALYVTQAGLGMPNRDYYLTPAFADKKVAYQAYVAKILTLSGWPDAEARAADIVAYETHIAEGSWTAAERRNPDNTYNPMSRDELTAFAPGFDWAGFLDASGLSSEDRIIIREKTAIPKIAAAFADTPLDTLKAWAAFHLADDAARYLPADFVQARFAFRDKALSGVPELEVRWKQAVDVVGSLNDGMGDAVGRIYVARYFPPESKAKMEALVENLRLAFAARIRSVDWMSDETKAAALDKLAKYRIEIGYTGEWRNYADLKIASDDLFGDAERSAAANWDFERRHLGKVVDRGEWHMTPQTVNAYNTSSLNEVVFPAAILQPPFFDPNADPAVNYGGIGAVIGHEMTHGFDDQGRKFDATGRLRDWWTAQDAERFKARAGVYGAEFEAYDTGLGLHIKPELTMGENIADLGGLNLALDAYHASLGGKPSPTIAGYSGDQRVFLGWAQVWASITRPDAEKRQIATDPHSPDHYRAITAERNIDAWYAAFDVQPGDKLYIAPSDRVKIW
jgi:putative endopeptidase